MPCCAFAAFLFSQMVLGLAAIKRIVPGLRADARSQTNPAVEWRLAAPGGAAPPSAIRKTPWHPRRLSLRLFALAAVLELALLCGAIYGVRAHLGHVHYEPVDAASHH